MAGRATVDALIDIVTDQTRDDMRRFDATVGFYLALLIGLGTIAADAGSDLPRGIAIAVTLAVVPAAATVFCALMVVWPRVTGRPAPGSWPHASRLPHPRVLLAVYTRVDITTTKAGQLWTLAGIAAAKATWVRRATVAFAVTIGYLVVVALVSVAVAVKAIATKLILGVLFSKPVVNFLFVVLFGH